MNKKTLTKLALLFVLIAAAIGIHQYVTWGIFFETKDALHHELFMVTFAFVGLTLWYIGREQK